MKMLRINVRIRDDVSPRLFETLANLPPRPRAELLRKLAELALHPASLPAQQFRSDESSAAVNMSQGREATDRNEFGDELVRVVGSLS